MNQIPDKKNERIIFSMLIALVAICIVVAVITFAYKRDFTLYAKIQCDPNSANCFTETCEEGDARCLAYMHADDVAYYQIAYFNAHDASACSTQECVQQLCENGKCLIFECTEENKSLIDTEHSCDSI